MNLSVISHRTLLGRLLRLPLRLIPSNAWVLILQGPLRGKKWIVGSAHHGWWLGSYERAEQSAFAANIKRGYTVYDLGANVGIYSLLASTLVGPEGAVFSFEPSPRNLQFLRRHLKLNRITNCVIWDAAVGQTEGAGNFDFGKSPSSGHLTTESKGTQTVRIVALDDLVASGKLPPPDVIKCDIEGAEFGALTGARETLVKYHPTIFLATHGPEEKRQCHKLLTELFYQLTPLDGRPLELSDEVLAIHTSR